MEINTYCPECENGMFLYEMPKPSYLSCKRCGKGRAIEGNGELNQQGAISKCALCGCRDFYRQKDFNTKLGLWITALIMGTAIIFLVLNHLKIGFSILAGGALLDLGLFFGLGDIVICYKCRGIYRGLPISAQALGFDLKIHDQYTFNKKK